MRHRLKSEKFSRSESQVRGLKKSLLRALLLEESIKTTHEKAKGLTIWAAKLITRAKVDNLHNRRLAYSELNDHKLVKRLFEDVALRFKDVPGGYTRMFDIGWRKGDCAKLSLIELTKLADKPKAVATKAAKKGEEGKEEKKSDALSAAKNEGKKAPVKGIKKLLAKKEKKEKA
jgi:large subunit ribosomal protein L17